MSQTYVGVNENVSLHLVQENEFTFWLYGWHSSPVMEYRSDETQYKRIFLLSGYNHPKNPAAETCLLSKPFVDASEKQYICSAILK